ncbi:MAG: hypothetical protein ACJ75T_07795 [Solirubrobacterales bacterium]
MLVVNRQITGDVVERDAFQGTEYVEADVIRQGRETVLLQHVVFAPRVASIFRIEIGKNPFLGFLGDESLHPLVVFTRQRLIDRETNGPACPTRVETVFR